MCLPCALNLTRRVGAPPKCMVASILASSTPTANSLRRVTDHIDENAHLGCTNAASYSLAYRARPSSFLFLATSASACASGQVPDCMAAYSRSSQTRSLQLSEAGQHASSAN